MSNQCKRVLEYIRLHGSITSAEAMTELGVYRLASRINDLRRCGIEIRREMVTVTNRWGEKTRIARYSLVEEAAA